MAKSSVTIRAAWISFGAVIAAALIGLLGNIRTSEPPNPDPRAALALGHVPGQLSTDASPVKTSPSPPAIALEMTMQQYFDKLDVLRQRYLERDDFVSSLEGKRILWRGFVGGVTGRAPERVSLFMTLKKDKGELPAALVTFESTWETKLYSMHEGDLVQVEGEYMGETPMMPSIRGATLTLLQASQK